MYLWKLNRQVFCLYEITVVMSNTLRFLRFLATRKQNTFKNISYLQHCCHCLGWSWLVKQSHVRTLSTIIRCRKVVLKLKNNELMVNSVQVLFLSSGSYLGLKLMLSILEWWSSNKTLMAVSTGNSWLTEHYIAKGFFSLLLIGTIVKILTT